LTARHDANLSVGSRTVRIGLAPVQSDREEWESPRGHQPQRSMRGSEPGGWVGGRAATRSGRQLTLTPQQQAIDRTREIVHNAGGGEVSGEVLIQGHNGKIHDKDTIDPGEGPFHRRVDRTPTGLQPPFGPRSSRPGRGRCFAGGPPCQESSSWTAGVAPSRHQPASNLGDRLHPRPRRGNVVGACGDPRRGSVASRSPVTAPVLPCGQCRCQP
jgi:hypothetical protein